MRNVELCVICMEPLFTIKNTHTLDCNHNYHHSCILKLVNNTQARKHASTQARKHLYAHYVENRLY